MSKTFKSASSERKVRIWEANLGVAVCVEDPITNETTSTQIAPPDAPALALAILEAAGADSDLTWSGAKDYGNADHLGWIAGHLGAYINTQERATAEAKEQAELEAEALEFMNAVRDATGVNSLTGFPAYASGIKSHYLLIARKAREMRKS